MTDRKDRQQQLFDLGPQSVAEPEVKRPKHPVWTENKARLIETYLRLFVLITKHGVYVDGFAGPQEPDKHEMWAAKLVLESRPRWFRRFYFFELDRAKVQSLEALAEEQPPRDRSRNEPKREVKVLAGDVNQRIAEVLNEDHIKQKEATFCLLDQRTFECEWSTVERVAAYKVAGENKVEIFYFLPAAWLNRAISGLKGDETIRKWWGKDDWEQIRDARGVARAQLFENRFRSDLGYKSAKAWPIFERPEGGKTMYYMIHATDHPDAPKLMARAYNQAVLTEQEFEQLAFDLGLPSE